MQETKDCVMVVGTTGTGKSSTINLYTGCKPPQATSSGDESVQQKIEMVKDLNHPEGPPWIDNPGWQDIKKADSDIFKNMLRHLQNNKIKRIKAVIWNVFGQNRADNNVASQAKFINQFADSEIWSNVIIITRGYVNEYDGQGAVKAAKNCFNGAQPTCLAYKFVTKEDEERISNGVQKVKNEEAKLQVEEMMKTERHNDHKYTDKEIKVMLEDIMKTLTPVPIKFNNKRCLDCGQVSDERLMEDICHKEKVKGHAGEMKQKYSKIVAGASTGGGAAAVAGLATTIIILDPSLLGIMALSPLLMAPGAYFSGHRALSGSVKPLPGVESMAGSCLPKMEYICEGVRCKDQEGGCIDVCSNCKMKWGEQVDKKKGCIYIKEQEKIKQKGKGEYIVFPKNHTLVDV